MSSNTQVFGHLPIVNKSLLLNKGCQLVLDIFFLAAAFLASCLLRFDFNYNDPAFYSALMQVGFALSIQLVVMGYFGVYKQIWRYLSIPEVSKICLALFVCALIFLICRLIFSKTAPALSIPISIIIMNLFVASISIVGLRTLRRIVYEEYEKKQTTNRNQRKKPVFLIGAGRAGVKTLAEIKSRGDIDIDVKGFIDDDPLKKGAIINGVKVVGTLRDLAKLLRKQPIDHVIISIAQTSRQNIQRIVKTCEEVPIKVRTIPGLFELIQDKVQISRIRDIQIDDLLGRPQIELDRESVEKFITGKRVMVTGAGGSIGSELVRQVLQCNPQSLILIERSEIALFNIEREIVRTFPGTEYQAIIADVCNESQMDKVFERHLPQVVFHAAAHKHVPLMESNTAEAIKNNIFGTLITARLAGDYQSEAFVLISTDKAVNPTSVMGATKRVAELVIQNFNQNYQTKFSAVRFGNVIGSAGSVIPIFQEQIKNGGPVTVTHPEMQRYFMTIPEATQLVLQAGTIGSGGEIFILDMGEQVKIVDLARETILLSGLKPDVDIEIVFQGIRPGEKLFEELQINSEALLKTFHPKIFIGKIYPYPAEKINKALEKFAILSLEENDAEIRHFLNELLPEAKIQPIKAKVNQRSNIRRFKRQQVGSTYILSQTLRKTAGSH